MDDASAGGDNFVGITAVTGEIREVIDERLTLNRRDIRGKKALHFVEPGKFIEEAEKIKLKEERKIIAGYASGRKALQVINTKLYFN